MIERMSFQEDLPGSSYGDSDTEEGPPKAKRQRLHSSNCVYTSYYGEENVWNLCQQIKKDTGALKEYFVVFISNKKKHVPLWMQKNGKDPLTPVIWDYHVILIQRIQDAKPLAYDLDSLLAFPCLLEDYVREVIQSEQAMKKEYHRKFRIVEAERFLETFASDRSHMRLPNGQYQKPPPSYPPIKTLNESMNLKDFINMSSSNENSYGRVKGLKGLLNMFGLSQHFA